MKPPFQHDRHAHSGEPDHRTNRKIKFPCNDEQPGTERNDAELRNQPGIVANTQRVVALACKGVPAVDPGGNREKSERQNQQYQHAKRTDLRSLD